MQIKETFFKNIISDCGGGGSKKIIWYCKLTDGAQKQTLLPQHDDSLALARLSNNFFITKIDKIRESSQF